MARFTLSTHWKFQRLARALGSKVLARGVLETLWEPCWVAGDAYCGTAADIEALCEWKGEAGALTKALLMDDAKTAGFIEPYEGRVRDTQPHYQVHDFLDHCPEYVHRRREREQESLVAKKCVRCGDEYFSRLSRSQYCSPRCRQAAFREQHPESVTQSVTHRDAAVTQPVTHRNATPKSCVTGCVTDPDPDRENSEQKGSVTQDRNANETLLQRVIRPVHSPVRTQGTSDTTAALRAAAPAAPDLPGLEIPEAPVPKRSVAPVPLSPVVLTYPTTGKGPPSWDLRADQLAEWQAWYPQIDVLAEARKALAWISADTKRRKTAGGMPKCLVSWFNRTIDEPRSRGPTTLTGSIKTAGNEAALKEFLKRRGHAVD
jgi:hypothetical protein